MSDDARPPAGTAPDDNALRRALARARDGKALDQAEAATLLHSRGEHLARLLDYASRTRDACPRGGLPAGRHHLFAQGNPDVLAPESHPLGQQVVRIRRPRWLPNGHRCDRDGQYRREFSGFVHFFWSKSPLSTYDVADWQEA